MLTYSVLMELASQRDAQIAEAARATRAQTVPATVNRPGAPRERARVVIRLRALVSRA